MRGAATAAAAAASLIDAAASAAAVVWLVWSVREATERSRNQLGSECVNQGCWIDRVGIGLLLHQRRGLAELCVAAG